MIRPDKIKSQIYGEVGFRQPTLTDYAIVDADNLTSRSGLYFEDASRLVTIKNIKDNQENVDITDDQFNDLLKEMQEQCIIDVCRKITHGESNYNASLNLYPYEKIFTRTLGIDDKYSCFRIIPTYQKNKVAKISFIELAFDSAKTFNIYLYNSNKPNAPIQTQEVTTVANESVIVTLNWFIDNEQEYKGGVFYLGYFESDLGAARPIARDYELAIVEYKTPNYYIEPVKLNYASTVINPDGYTTQADTGGLNIGVETYTDYTELLIKNRNILAECIQTQMGIEVLDLIKHSTRINDTQRINQGDIQDINMAMHGYKDTHVLIEGLIKKNNRNITDIKKMLFYKPKIRRKTIG